MEEFPGLGQKLTDLEVTLQLVEFLNLGEDEIKRSGPSFHNQIEERGKQQNGFFYIIASLRLKKKHIFIIMKLTC